ncbi:MAG: DedA family protein, partial [Muribaculaceae bacterium]|nr:DedA family protein [Muribaculaceae bacterium]
MIENILPLISITDIFNAKEFFAWFIENASYLFVFVFMVIESSFIPFPSEVVVPPAAYLAVQHGQHAGQDMNVYMVVVVATLGAIVGALINYGLSVWIGRPIVYKFADSRIGHACMIDRAKVEKAERYFDDHGAASTFIGRLIPAVRQLISIPAGIARMNLAKFIVFTGLGALLWNAVLAGLGVLLG